MLKVMRWFFGIVAGCAAFVALWVALMASGFGGVFDASVIFWAACFPLFLLFLWRPTWGAVAFLGYLLAGWALGAFTPLKSVIDNIVLICVCGIGLSYACFCAANARQAPTD